ncbi:MAG TPA: arylamine N-acetyltransferase, partial [Pseudolabrys sp.]|nr:arylamine N-acetyltransferase [Pseudolabrys sp.]
WTALYATDLAESIPADFEMGNWFTSAHPESIFVKGLLAARADADRRYALFNNSLSVHKLRNGTEKRTLNARELRDALGDLFKIRLDGLDGLDAALARVADAPA